METIVLSTNDEDLLIASRLLRNGHVVGIPTETVYGLGADATNPEAVKKYSLIKEKAAHQTVSG